MDKENIINIWFNNKKEQPKKLNIHKNIVKLDTEIVLNYKNKTSTNSISKNQYINNITDTLSKDIKYPIYKGIIYEIPNKQYNIYDLYIMRTTNDVLLYDKNGFNIINYI